ncbi:MAG TPA: hypothetical protein VJS92_10450, partial [Candidatus Polarisedimenticolaceae bacterium]|nr:hypothetical protein [Candidatus Polarisedimenticolaceae bacterium]
GRNAVFEVGGLAGLSLSAALIAAAAELRLGPALGAAALAFSYSVSSLAYVRAQAAAGGRRRAAVLACVAIHGLLAGGLLALAAAGSIPAWSLLALVPIAARTAIGLAGPQRNVVELGRRELWVALAFTALAAVTLAAARV